MEFAVLLRSNIEYSFLFVKLKVRLNDVPEMSPSLAIIFSQSAMVSKQ